MDKHSFTKARRIACGKRLQELTDAYMAEHGNGKGGILETKVDGMYRHIATTMTAEGWEYELLREFAPTWKDQPQPPTTFH